MVFRENSSKIQKYSFENFWQNRFFIVFFLNTVKRWPSNFQWSWEIVPANYGNTSQISKLFFSKTKEFNLKTQENLRWQHFEAENPVHNFAPPTKKSKSHSIKKHSNVEKRGWWGRNSCQKPTKRPLAPEHDAIGPQTQKDFMPLGKLDNLSSWFKFFFFSISCFWFCYIFHLF